MNRVSALLVANNFPPVRGGSAQVYACLAAHAHGRLHVLAPRLSYIDGRPLAGARAYDAAAPCPITRIRLLRTIMVPAPPPWSRLRLLFADLRIRLSTLMAVALVVLRYRPRAICIGELLASGWLAVLLCRLRLARVILYVHGEEITTAEPYDPDFARRRRTLCAADHVVVVSRFTAQEVVRLIGQPLAGKVVLIENGVDCKRFTPGPRDAGLSARLGLSGRFVYITVCRLVEKKGVDNALRAFAALRNEFPDSHYLVVGTGSFADRLHRLAAELAVSDHVTFAGDIPDGELVAHYRLGDVFLMPNRALPNGDTEGFGLVFLEANACGLPVIAGRAGGSIDAVQDGVNGLVVDGQSVEAITDAMRRLRQDETLFAHLVDGGHRAAAAADWSLRTQRFLDLCERVPQAHASAAA